MVFIRIRAAFWLIFALQLVIPGVFVIYESREIASENNIFRRNENLTSSSSK